MIDAPFARIDHRRGARGFVGSAIGAMRPNPYHSPVPAGETRSGPASLFWRGVPWSSR